jgi:hypothetical protein
VRGGSDSSKDKQAAGGGTNEHGTYSVCRGGINFKRTVTGTVKVVVVAIAISKQILLYSRVF